MLHYRLTLFTSLLLSGCSIDSEPSSIIIKNGTSIEERLKIYKDLVKGICRNEETVNRNFLQQTWYHSRDFRSFAYVFGTYGFSQYENNQTLSRPETEGIYCIDGNNINALYFKTDFVPGDLSFKKATLYYDEKLTFLRKEVIKVISINKHEMVLNFSTSNTQQNYYRKN